MSFQRRKVAPSVFFFLVYISVCIFDRKNVLGQNVGSVSADNLDATTRTLVDNIHGMVPADTGEKNAEIQRKAIDEEKDALALQRSLSEEVETMKESVIKQSGMFTLKNKDALYPRLVKTLEWQSAHHSPVKLSAATKHVQSQKLIRGALMSGTLRL